jgi:hypothetical protein
VKKARRAGALYGGREPSPLDLKPPGVPQGRDREVGFLKGREGRGGERDSGSGPMGGRRPRGQKAQESKRPRPDLSHQGSRRGHGFSGGGKPLRRRYQAERVGRKARERKKEAETLFSITGEEEGSEGRSPGVWGAERGFQGIGQAHTAERVAKPWGWDF